MVLSSIRKFPHHTNEFNRGARTFLLRFVEKLNCTGFDWGWWLLLDCGLEMRKLRLRGWNTERLNNGRAKVTGGT